MGTTATAATEGPVSFNPYAWDVHDDPFPFYRRLRDEAPCYRNDELGFWALSRYDDVLAALHDTETYCSRHGITLEAKSPLQMMITMDPPEHTKFRRLISRAFTPRRIADLEPYIRMRTTELLDRIAANRGAGELIADFAGKLPMDVISTLLGVPAADQDELRHWTDLMVIRDEGNPTLPAEGEAAGMKVFEYFLADVRAKRANPGDDLTSSLLTAEVDGETLDDMDIVGFCFLLIIAGNETTTKLLGNAHYWLAQNPDERRLLADDPSLVPNAVEEVLRYEGSTQLMARTIDRPVELHGEHMATGDKVLLLLGSGNRDERVWDRPDVFDVRRAWPQQHLSFGHGIHVCLGAALARMEMRVALEEILARFPTWDIDESGLERMHGGNVRGWSKVPITFHPA